MSFMGWGLSWFTCRSIRDVEYNPWGGSDITITDLNSKVNIDKNTLLQLIKDSEKLSALEAEGVDNWEGYNLAIRELNTGYQKDAITDDVLIKQYCEWLILKLRRCCSLIWTAP